MTALLWSAAGASLVGAAALLAMRGRGRARVLAVAGADSFDDAERRTWLLWGCLATVLVALLLAVVVDARAEPAGARIVPPGDNAIIVIDLSTSTRKASTRIADALLGLTQDGTRRLGLVVFSDTAYEALPPSAPVESIRDWLDLFAHYLPVSYPWTRSFSSGTWISSGLLTARQMLRRDRVPNPRVVLVSDLIDATPDLPTLQTVVAQYQREGIDLTVIAVPSDEGGAAGPSFYEQQNAGFVARAAHRTIEPRQLGGGDVDVPLLVILIAILGLVAAAHELFFHPITWRAQP